MSSFWMEDLVETRSSWTQQTANLSLGSTMHDLFLGGDLFDKFHHSCLPVGWLPHCLSCIGSNIIQDPLTFYIPGVKLTGFRNCFATSQMHYILNYTHIMSYVYIYIYLLHAKDSVDPTMVAWWNHHRRSSSGCLQARDYAQGQPRRRRCQCRRGISGIGPCGALVVVTGDASCFTREKHMSIQKKLKDIDMCEVYWRYTSFFFNFSVREWWIIIGYLWIGWTQLHLECFNQ